ncbi:MAG: hypothetical protein ACYSWU_12590 [Planctomycetota bacterium]|jgi:hypothetical protein
MAKKRTAKKKVTGRPESRTAKTERPSKATSRAGGRPQRNARSIGDFRDILGVLNKDPDWRYRWILSTGEFDKRIFDARQAGWEFVDATQESDLIPGEYAVNKTDTDGSLYRIPAGRRTKDEFLYLMRLPEEYAKEVDAWKAQKTDDREADMFRTKSEDDDEKGQYSIRQEIDDVEMHKPFGD